MNEFGCNLDQRIGIEFRCGPKFESFGGSNLSWPKDLYENTIE